MLFNMHILGQVAHKHPERRVLVVEATAVLAPHAAEVKTTHSKLHRPPQLHTGLSLIRSYRAEEQHAVHKV